MTTPPTAAPVSQAETILLVDDQPENCEVAQAQLEGAGYKVVVVDRAEAAIVRVEQGGIDLVLLDVMMPKVDGFEIFHRIRASNAGAEIPVILLAVNDSATLSKAKDLGATDFIGKPINPTELLMRVRSLLWMRRLAEQLRQGHQLIRSQHDAVLRAQHRKEELINLVVHDLKNPIASILANAHFLLRENSLSEESREASRDIHQAADAMQRMVLNLLDISRSEEGALIPKLSEIDVPSLVDEVLGAMGRRAQERQQRIRVKLGPEVKRNVGDRDLLLRVLENLLDNAIKYSPIGSTIEVAATHAADHLDFAIRDEGPGIPSNCRDRIFEKYIQLDESTRSLARTGPGLGLAFCRLAAEAHGGRIWVEDNVPKGAAFRVRLPATSPSPSPSSS